MALFNMLRQPFIFLPISLSTGLQDAVSLARIQAFMLREELPKKPKHSSAAANGSGDEGGKKKKKTKKDKEDSDTLIVAKNADLNWNVKTEGSTPILSDVSFKVR